jgi:hypothetical protein
MSLGEAFPQILQAARLGEEWAWRALYDNLAPSVLGYLRARGSPDPEDLTGEVFLHLDRPQPSRRRRSQADAPALRTGGRRSPRRVGPGG